jgi:hypothetical protein
MGSFTRIHEYTNDPETLSEESKKYREELEKIAKDKGAIGTVADGSIRITSKKIKSENGGITTIDNPLKQFSSKDAFKLNDKEKNHYLRFGALLEFLVDNIIPITTASRITPMFNIDVDSWYNYMYSLPNQISLDPRVCLVRNSQFNTEKGNIKILNEIPYFFKEIDNPRSINKSENSAYPLNIYLNFNFILECLKSDEKGNVSVYELISNICTGLNKALGGINNLEPIIDEETNTLQIIDTTPIPGHSASANFKGYLLQIYGYDKIDNDYISNFVRKVDLKTAITPEYATMITVGATAGGYVKGTEATAFSKWNTGLVDRFKEKFIPPTKTKETAETDEKDPAIMYADEFVSQKGFSSRYGWTSLNPNFKFSDNFIEKNISTVTEYYKWLIAKNAEGKDVSGGTVGFIPFKLGLTLDGISGIKIYNVLRVNTEFLPKAYGKSVDLIITGVSHRLNNSDWETSIEATVMPKTGEMALVAITAEQAEETLNEAISLPANKSLKEVLISANYKPGTFVFELALAIGTKEGYTKGSKNRPSRNNNPGNLDGSSYKDIDPGVTLEPTNSKGDRRFAKFTTPEFGAKALIERKIKGWAKGNYPGTIVNGKSKNSDTYRQQYNVPSSLKGISGQKTNLTIEQFFYIYAPPSENNTIGYIDSIVKTLIKNYPKVTKNTKIIDYINK